MPGNERPPRVGVFIFASRQSTTAALLCTQKKVAISALGVSQTGPATLKGHGEKWAKAGSWVSVARSLTTGMFLAASCTDSERRHSAYLDYVSSANWQGRRALLGDPRTFTLSTHFHF